MFTLYVLHCTQTLNCIKSHSRMSVLIRIQWQEICRKSWIHFSVTFISVWVGGSLLSTHLTPNDYFHLHFISCFIIIFGCDDLWRTNVWSIKYDYSFSLSDFVIQVPPCENSKFIFSRNLWNEPEMWTTKEKLWTIKWKNKSHRHWCKYIKRKFRWYKFIYLPFTALTFWITAVLHWQTEIFLSS